jgi:dihydroorotase
MTYDLLLRGGEVPGLGRRDVAVQDGRIAAVEPSIAAPARSVQEIGGRIVTPGLIDLHTHLGGGYWGIDPEPVAWYTGVTTWVDAGSFGAYTLAGRARSALRTPVLLNISAVGLSGRTGESRDLANCDVDLAIATVLAHRETIRGIKVRIDAETVGANGVEPLRRALSVAATCGIPVMTHIGTAPPALAEVLDLLRAGDIVTHCASGIANPLGAAARQAYERGVLFDVGHGSGGFAFDVLEAQLAAGMAPHTVSTDLHARSLYGPAFDLPTTMSKLLAAGMELPAVLAAATLHPARALGLSGGTLDVGAPADLAVFTVEEGAFPVADAHKQIRTAPLRLVNEATYLAGRRLEPRLPAPPPPWIPLTDAQRGALARRERHLRTLLTEPLVGPDALADQFPRPSARRNDPRSP